MEPRRRRTLVIGAFVVITLAGALTLTAISFHRAFRTGGNFDNAMSGLGDVFGGSLARMVVVQKDDPVREEIARSGASEAYNKNPEAYRQNATLLDTWLQAREVALVAFQTPGLHLPIRSDELKSAAGKPMLDHWGRPFCISGDNETLIVVSAGETRRDVACVAKLSREALQGIPRGVLMKSESGYLVLVADKGQPGLGLVLPAKNNNVRVIELQHGKSSPK